FLTRLAAGAGVEEDRTVAVGDGANDLDMMAVAQLGIAFCAKPTVREQADVVIDEPDLRRVLDVLGVEPLPQADDEGGHPLRPAMRWGPQRPIACTPPSTWRISPVVAGNQSERSIVQAFAVGTGSPTSQPSGARSSQDSSNCSKPGMDFAAVVLIGPAATRLQRTPFGPRSRAR